MKKLIAIAILFLMAIPLFSKYDGFVTKYTSEDMAYVNSLIEKGYIMLPEVVVTAYRSDTIKQTDRMNRMDRPMMNQRFMRNPRMNHRNMISQRPPMIPFNNDVIRHMNRSDDRMMNQMFRPMMMVHMGMRMGERGRMMNPMFHGDTIRQKEMMNHRHMMIQRDSTRFWNPRMMYRR